MRRPSSPLRPLALLRARLRLRRRPLLWWACVLSCSLGLGVVISGRLAAAAELPRCAVAGPRRPAGPADHLTAGSRALAVPTGPGALALRPGDRVDVLATFDPLVAPRGEDPTATVARGATVVAVRGQGVTVAVSAVEAPRVAFALSQATIALALAPPGTVAGDGR